MTDLFEYAVTKVFESCPGPKNRSRNLLIFRCPVCGDSKKSKYKMRGYLYGGDKPSFFCFNCQTNLDLYGILAVVEGKDRQEVRKEIVHHIVTSSSKEDLQKFIMKMNGREQSPPLSGSIDEQPKYNVPNDWMGWKTNDACKRELERRLVDRAPFVPSGWTPYYSQKTNRIVIPWTRGSKILYFQLRALNNEFPKYLFPKGGTKPCFGLDTVDHNLPYLMIMEGALDSMFVANGVAIGGLFPSVIQMQELESLGIPLVRMTDNFWKDEASKSAVIDIFKRDPHSYIYMWKKDQEKDVNDEVIKKNDPKIFADPQSIISRIVPIAKAKMAIAFNRE